MPENQKRTYYWTEFIVAVLSEEPLEQKSLEDLPALINNGPCVMHTFSSQSRQAKPCSIAKMLKGDGNEPEFIGLTLNGATSTIKPSTSTKAKSLRLGQQRKESTCPGDSNASCPFCYST
jgi:hypothetical protein